MQKKLNKKINKLKIAIVQQSPDFGGAESYMLSLIEEFKKAGNDVSVISNKSKFLSEARKSKVVTYSVPYVLDIIGNWKGLIKSIIFLLPSAIFYFRILKEQQGKGLDVVLMSGFSEKMLVSYLSLFLKIPVVWIEYSRLDIVFQKNFSIPKFIYLKLSRNISNLIVPTEYAKEGLINQGIDRKKIKILPLGTKLVKLRKSRRNGNFVIGNVSRLTYEKGQHLIVDVMPEIIKKIPNAKLLIVGDGPGKEMILKTAKELGVADKVKVVGFVKKIDSYYNEMNVFVFPSIWKLEGFGLVVVEAMARKIPVIANNINHMSEIIIDGRNGLLFNAHDKTDLKNKIIKIYNDKKLKDNLAENAYKDVVSKYDISINAKKIIDVLKLSL